MIRYVEIGKTKANVVATLLEMRGRVLKILAFYLICTSAKNPFPQRQEANGKIARNASHYTVGYVCNIYDTKIEKPIF